MTEQIDDTSSDTALRDWNQLRKACADQGATLILRAETLGDFRFSLAARDRQGRLIHDVRRDLGDEAPQTALAQMIRDAVGSWWQ
jgi:hypothetical protein